MPDDYADQVADVAQELVVRVRDDDPEANARYIRSVVDGEQDLIALALVLAAAVPTDQPWRHLTAWTHVTKRELMPCGTVAAYRRHKTRNEMACPACTEAMRDYDRTRKALSRQQPVGAPVDGA
jgi:hypothetical protein